MRLLIAFGFAFYVASAASAQTVSFQNEVMPILSRAGCNSGPCHGNLNGKGGFKLSLRGESPASDWLILTRDTLARRVTVSQPDESLLLKKATGQIPHEGGIRFTKNTPEYQLLHKWIADGAAKDSGHDVEPVSLTVTPSNQIVMDPVDRVQLKAEAQFSDGSRRDVTHLATFETTNVGIAKVLSSGEVHREQTGELIVLVRYGQKQAPVRIVFLPKRDQPNHADFNTAHPIDRLVQQQWQELRLQPAKPSSDEVFLRRLYLDTIGRLPSPEEARRFIDDGDTQKRQKLVDHLLNRDEFASFWAQKWSDLLRNEERTLDRKGVQVFFHWIKGWLNEDRPLNDFARAILSARGSTYTEPAANFFRSIRDPYIRAESAAQVFLGLRISCARCHNHPFDRWTQDDYHRFAGFFARIDYRVLENNRRDNLDKHEFVGEQIVLTKSSGELPHPRGGSAMPKLLTEAASAADADQGDRLMRLADWVAEPNNPYFAQAQVNRVWLHLIGRGLVDPNDDFRTSNPPSHPALLNHLVEVFRHGGLRLKPLVRHILTSQVYQLSSSPHPANAGEEIQLAQAWVQPLEAEQLLTAIGQVLEVPIKFPGYPTGLAVGELPAMPLAGGRRGADSRGLRFLKMFGKPERLLTCECERSEDPGVLQAFQLLTGELLQSALREPNNRIGKALKSGLSADSLLEEIYLSGLSRRPTPKEREKILHYVSSAADPRAAWEDIVWAVLNTKEFLVRR